MLCEVAGGLRELVHALEVVIVDRDPRDLQAPPSRALYPAAPPTLAELVLRNAKQPPGRRSPLGSERPQR
ncbi:MAG TPA: hypothetical protein VG165_11500 [Solirubrobacteraceae bacterium]|nr:hypothetical protein [Solirubrobacteraceae bacterium]